MNTLFRCEVLKSISLFFILSLFLSGVTVYAQDYSIQISGFKEWLFTNRQQENGLPYSHVGDDRFKNWTITYDAALVALAYIAIDEVDEAKKIVDYYFSTPTIERLGGVIEAFIPTDPIQGQDWSVRSGANIWMGLASFHLYKKTGEKKYLEAAQMVALWVMSLQNDNRKDANFGGIRLGPLGDPQYQGDQHISYDTNRPSYYSIYATEINIDAYALMSMLFLETKNYKYQKVRAEIMNWMRKVALNKEVPRFNRGYHDAVIATDVQSWAVSALGKEVLDLFQPDLAEDLIKFIEDNCYFELEYKKESGEIVSLSGVDFIDKKRLQQLERKPLISPEWSFQLVNAYGSLAKYFKKIKNLEKAKYYENKKQDLIKNILLLASKDSSGLSLPYATLADAIIGHEYRTPIEGNKSTSGVAYGILALTGFDPLFVEK